MTAESVYVFAFAVPAASSKDDPFTRALTFVAVRLPSAQDICASPITTEHCVALGSYSYEPALKLNVAFGTVYVDPTSPVKEVLPGVSVIDGFVTVPDFVYANIILNTSSRLLPFDDKVAEPFSGDESTPIAAV